MLYTLLLLDYLKLLLYNLIFCCLHPFQYTFFNKICIWEFIMYICNRFYKG